MDLTDPERDFNTPTNFFHFAGEYYKSGFVSSQFGLKSEPLWPDINPLMLDQTQYKSSFGTWSKAEYDDLLHRLRDIGVTRKYKIRRFIYWPYPGAGQPALTATQKQKLRWVVNQNRYPYLGFVPVVEGEGEKTFPLLCPGETVTLQNTCTRLDGFPLRLAMDGYHTGPKPDGRFTQTHSGKDPRNGRMVPSDQSFDLQKEWSYFTLRLPITIGPTNNTIYSRGGGLSRYGDPEYFLKAYMTSTPGPALGPYNVATTLFGQNLGIYPLKGKVVKAVPLDGSTPFTNGSALNGNIVIVQFTPGFSLSSTAIANNAIAAGAKGLIIIDDAPGPVDINANGGFNANAPIPSIQMSPDDGTPILNAITAGKTVNIDVKLESPIHKIVLPSGTFYLTDLFQQLFDSYVNGESEFYIEVGNFISGYYGWNDIFALGGTVQALLFGPNDPNYKSSFFGPSGLDIGYLWAAAPSKPLVTELQFQSIDFYDGTYAQLSVGQYKTHTPLTSVEAQALITALDSSAVPTVEAQHGPVTLDMPYDKYVACLNELSMAKGAEDHTVIHPWVRKSDNGMYEFPTSMRSLLESLKRIQLDPTATYVAPFNDVDGIAPDSVSPIPGVPTSATFAPEIYSIGIRATIGHPGEFSEMYNAGYARNSTEDQARGEGRLEWIMPRVDQTMYYKTPTVVPVIGDVSGRQVEIPIINYLEDPQWLGARKFTSGPYTGAPDYFFIPYVQHTGETGRIPVDGAVFHPQAVPGDWLVGVLKDAKARSILGLGPAAPVPRVGYITWYTSKWATDGDSSILPWYDPNFSTVDAAAIVAVARIFQLFNSKQVKHIVIDVRNTGGGGETFWNAFCALAGGKRYFGLTDATPVMTLEPNGLTLVKTGHNFQVAKEEAGAVTYNYQSTILDCNPDAFVAAGLLSVVPNGVWNGEVTGQAALGKRSNIMWLANATATSNPQYKCLLLKSTSLDQVEYNGDLGKSTQFVEYGVYYRPFSTSGSYDSYLNWWTKGRVGEEENPIGLMMGLDRWEASRSAYFDGNVDGKGGVLKGLDQEFSNLHRPHIKWDMNATVYYQDVGFVVGNSGVNVITDGEPWVPSRYPDVKFGQPLTYRDSTLERCVQMVNDVNLNSHFYQEDGYGFVSKPPA